MSHTCPCCAGKGIYRVYGTTNTDGTPQTFRCDICNGIGLVSEECVRIWRETHAPSTIACPSCNGTGRIMKSK